MPIAVELSPQLSQYIEYSMNSVVGSGTQRSSDVKQLITRTIGPHPIIQVTIGGVITRTIGPRPIIQATIGGVITRTIGPHPIIQVTIGEVTVDCLVDSGSQVSMIEECFLLPG